MIDTFIFSTIFHERMQRKVIQQGPATLSVSLPSQWLKQFNVKKGDVLSVQEEGAMVKISPSEITSVKKKFSLSTKGLDCSLLTRAIAAAYTSGYDEIVIDIDDMRIEYNSSLLEYKNERYKEKTVNVLVFLQDISSFYLGFEIISQNPQQVIFKELAQTTNTELRTIEKRILSICVDMGKAMLECLEKKEDSYAETCAVYELSMNKFYRYYLRMQNKSAIRETYKMLAQHDIITHIEEVCDGYRQLSKLAVTKNMQHLITLAFKKRVQQVISIINRFITYYSTKQEKELSQLYKDNREILRELDKDVKDSQMALSAELKHLLFHNREMMQNYLQLQVE